tara:strand:+ start:48 stop:752 length:705 start_codon:yes stop_codon:yes gene_type:complete
MKGNMIFTYNRSLDIVRENPRFNYLNDNNTKDYSCTSNPVNCNKRYNSHFRMPINHWRKTTNCQKNCLTNEKVIIDSSANMCYTKQYYMSRLTDKNGFKIQHKSFSSSQYLQYKNYSYNQNAQGNTMLLATSSDKKKYTFFSHEKSTNIKSSEIKKPCNIIVKNPNNIPFNTQGAVSGRARINKLKNKNNVFNKYNCVTRNCKTNNKFTVSNIKKENINNDCPSKKIQNVKNKC